MPTFRVTGSNRETSARMTLELAAASKGDAERKAAASGMIVAHVAPISQNTVEESNPTMALKNYRDEGPKGNTKMLVIILIIMAIAALVFYTLILPNWDTTPPSQPAPNTTK